MFLHERGAYNTLYFTVYFGSLMVSLISVRSRSHYIFFSLLYQVGPIIAGPMTEHSNWRNFWWLNVALHAAILVGLVFLFPETKWHRQHPKELMAQPQLAVTSDKDMSTQVVEDPEKTSNNGSDQITAPAENKLEPTNTADQDPYLHKGSPSKQQWKLWQNNSNPFKSILLDLWIPWKLFAFPIVEFASFVVSWSASSFLTINLTQTQNFAAPPYNMSSQSIGFTNFAILVGAGIGLATNGPLSDWIAARATRKNRGIREPEMRLPTLIPYVLIMLLGNFIVAFGYEHKWRWEVRHDPGLIA